MLSTYFNRSSNGHSNYVGKALKSKLVTGDYYTGDYYNMTAVSTHARVDHAADHVQLLTVSCVWKALGTLGASQIKLFIAFAVLSPKHCYQKQLWEFEYQRFRSRCACYSFRRYQLTTHRSKLKPDRSEAILV